MSKIKAQASQVDSKSWREMNAAFHCSFSCAKKKKTCKNLDNKCSLKAQFYHLINLKADTVTLGCSNHVLQCVDMCKEIKKLRGVFKKKKYRAYLYRLHSDGLPAGVVACVKPFFFPGL